MQAPDKVKIIYAYASFYRGAGGEMHPLVLAKHLDRSKYDFAICVIEDARSHLRVEIEQCGGRIYDLHLSRRFYNVVNMIRVVYGYYRTFKRTRPDIVQTQAMHANLLARPAAKLAGVPIVISTENTLPDIETSWFRRLLNAPLHGANRLLDHFTDRIVVVSEDLRRRKRTQPSIDKTEVIPPPFNIDAYQAARRQFPEAPPLSNLDRVVIGIIGRLSPEKGHRDLIAAMPKMLAHLPGAHLVIVGSGPLEAELKAQVNALQLTKSVTFRGYQPHVFAELATIDILFVPSRSDAFPIVVLEGMAMGRPVVGTRVGGIPEQIREGETGLLVAPGDTDGLVEAFHYLTSHAPVAVRMGKQGQNLVMTTFHPSQFIAKHEALYDHVQAGRD